jgi:hypothetical protein
MKNLAQIESAESASPVITRLLGQYLAGNEASVFEFKAWEKVGLRLLNLLPLAAARKAVRWRFLSSALDPRQAMRVTTQDLVSARLQDYKAIRGRKFPAIITGAALGGASAHLAAVLGVPFLPQPFILGLRGGSPKDELDPHIELTTRVATEILDRNPGLMAIAHFDPVHDGWLTRIVSHLRLKLISLPQEYRRFIKEILEPGGAIVYLDCKARWLQFEFSERHRYQVGGWGGIPPGEFLEGSERIDEALARAGSPHKGGWKIDGVAAVDMPESEWGSEPGLAGSLKLYADQEGYRFHRLIGDDPNWFSTLAYKAHERLYKQLGRTPQGVVVETFTQYDPGLVLCGGLIPLWLIFNTTDSLSFLKTRVLNFPSGLPIYFSGLVTLSRTPDMVPWDDWARALSNFDMHNIGARPNRYPEDLVSLWAWSERLRKHLDPKTWDPGPATLDLDTLLDLAASVHVSYPHQP